VLAAEVVADHLQQRQPQPPPHLRARKT